MYPNDCAIAIAIAVANAPAATPASMQMLQLLIVAQPSRRANSVVAPRVAQKREVSKI